MKVKDIQREIYFQKKTIKHLKLTCVSLLVIMIGMLFNFYAVIYNGGKMPFYYEAPYESERHFSFQNPSEVKLFYLTDIIHLPGSFWSIGDLIMMGGLAFLISILLFRLVFYRKKKQNLKYFSFLYS